MLVFDRYIVTNALDRSIGSGPTCVSSIPFTGMGSAVHSHSQLRPARGKNREEGSSQLQIVQNL